MRRKANVSAAWLLSSAVLLVHPAAADLLSAQEAYSKGDFAKAISDFREPVRVIRVDIAMSDLSSAIHNTGH
jgi:hypothetical protein